MCRLFSGTIVIIFICQTIFSSSLASAQGAQTVLNLPVPGMMVQTTEVFVPTFIKGMTIHPENPLEFNFIIDTGDTGITGDALVKESNTLIKYFLASLTIPEDELWVNLSPYEKERIIAQNFGYTEMGRDLLAQDYLLKQLTASLMYPEDDLGSEFWDRVYEKAQEEFGTTEIPINTFNKVWIVPEKAMTYQHGQTVFVLDSHLKVMLEEDYLALMENVENENFGMDQRTEADNKIANKISSDIVREVILPEIEREVNEGKTFAKLRQIYQALILATWYKINLQETLLGQVYADQSKTAGVHVADKEIKQKIYNQYLSAFKKGVYDYIRDDFDPSTQQIIPRKYFSGGAWLKGTEKQLIQVVGSPVEIIGATQEKVQQLLSSASSVTQITQFDLSVNVHGVGSSVNITALNNFMQNLIIDEKQLNASSSIQEVIDAFKNIPLYEVKNIFTKEEAILYDTLFDRLATVIANRREGIDIDYNTILTRRELSQMQKVVDLYAERSAYNLPEDEGLSVSKKVPKREKAVSILLGYLNQIVLNEEDGILTAEELRDYSNLKDEIIEGQVQGRTLTLDENKLGRIKFLVQKFFEKTRNEFTMDINNEILGIISQMRFSNNENALKWPKEIEDDAVTDVSPFVVGKKRVRSFLEVKEYFETRLDKLRGTITQSDIEESNKDAQEDEKIEWTELIKQLEDNDWGKEIDGEIRIIVKLKKTQSAMEVLFGIKQYEKLIPIFKKSLKVKVDNPIKYYLSRMSDATLAKTHKKELEKLVSYDLTQGDQKSVSALFKKLDNAWTFFDLNESATLFSKYMPQHIKEKYLEIYEAANFTSIVEEFLRIQDGHINPSFFQEKILRLSEEIENFEESVITAGQKFLQFYEGFRKWENSGIFEVEDMGEEKTLAESIKALREHEGFQTVEALRKAAGVKYNVVYNLELGVLPRDDNLNKILKALGVTDYGKHVLIAKLRVEREERRLKKLKVKEQKIKEEKIQVIKYLREISKNIDQNLIEEIFVQQEEIDRQYFNMLLGLSAKEDVVLSDKELNQAKKLLALYFDKGESELFASSPFAVIPAKYGGINLDPTLFEWQLRMDDQGMVLPVDQQIELNGDVQGFFPVIINVTPIQSLPLYLGMNESELPFQQDQQPTNDSVYFQAAVFSKEY
ncbi:Exonuclease SbcC [hydrothermal vent metagenome]|uniref:Exonuclease SbcC n=1 Tax=hydrothermal vent metagenome TaxID=652676 RepID=A0A3B1DXC6_9ZZZZ